MNAFDVFSHNSIKQDNHFDSQLINNIQHYVNDGYHIMNHSYKEFTEDMHCIAIKNEVSKVLLSNNNGSVIEIVATKNKFIDQITTYHYKTKRVKTSTTTFECAR